MKNKFTVVGLLLAFAAVLPFMGVNVYAASVYELSALAAYATTPQFSAALAMQANQNAAAANNNAIAKQQQADQAMLLAIAASQTAYNKQAEANLAAINAAAANQAACATIIANNPVLYVPVAPAPCYVDPKTRNLELLHNINTIDQARIAAVNARAAANMTLTRLNDVNALLNATKAEVVTNPGLTQRLNELTVQSNALKAQYDQQNSDASAKETTFNRLKATLPTAGYDPSYWKCYY